MIKLKIFSILVFCMVLMGCSTTLETTKMQNYGWNPSVENYTPVTFAYEREAEFKINKRKSEFSYENEEGERDSFEIEVISMVEIQDLQPVQNIEVYKGILNNEVACKVIISYENIKYRKGI